MLFDEIVKSLNCEVRIGAHDQQRVVRFNFNNKPISLIFDTHDIDKIEALDPEYALEFAKHDQYGICFLDLKQALTLLSLL